MAGRHRALLERIEANDLDETAAGLSLTAEDVRVLNSVLCVGDAMNVAVRLDDLQCSMPGCEHEAGEPGEFTYCDDHAHVWEVQYRNGSTFNGQEFVRWVRVRATSQHAAVERVRLQHELRGARWEFVSAERVT